MLLVLSPIAACASDNAPPCNDESGYLARIDMVEDWLLRHRGDLGIDIPVSTTCDSGSGTEVWAKVLDRAVLEDWMKACGCRVHRACLVDLGSLPSVVLVKEDLLEAWPRP